MWNNGITTLTAMVEFVEPVPAVAVRLGVFSAVTVPLAGQSDRDAQTREAARRKAAHAKAQLRVQIVKEGRKRLIEPRGDQRLRQLAPPHDGQHLNGRWRARDTGRRLDDDFVNQAILDRGV